MVSSLESPSPAGSRDNIIIKLIKELQSTTSKSKAKYLKLRNSPGELGSYPLDVQGYALAFDPIKDEENFFEVWSRFGVVVSPQVAPTAARLNAINRVKEVTKALSHGRCDLDDAFTYENIPCDDSGTPFISRGFFELYHDDALAQIRQLIRLYIHHVLLWGDYKLWSSFDRLGVKLPQHRESRALPLHVDQNPNIHERFKTTQGVLALEDCPAERGTLVVVPGSKSLFLDYAPMAQRGEYVELEQQSALMERLNPYVQALPIRAGDYVSWDSRTTHSNTANISTTTRFVAYISQGPVPHDEQACWKLRQEALLSGLGSNQREALMHASKKPRYTAPQALNRLRKPEQLSLLGDLLYGKISYTSIA